MMMEEVRNILQKCSLHDARRALYFLVRYFKQAHFLDKDGKDIFDDVFDRSTPEVRDLTVKIIALIEGSLGKTASELDDDSSDQVLQSLTALGREFQPEFSEEELRRASAFLQGTGQS